LLLLKVVAKNLIQWKRISSSDEFVQSNIPSLINTLYDLPIEKIAEKYEFISVIEEIDFMAITLMYWNIVGGCLLALGLRYAGTGDEPATNLIKSYLARLCTLKVTQNQYVADNA